MFICQYCNSERINKNSKAQHEIRCKSNPNRIKLPLGMLGKRGGNQWTKARKTGIPYVLSEETRKKMSESSAKRKHTPETKQKLSRIRKKYLSKNPNMVPYKLNHYSNGPSYPEIYWRGILDSHNINYVEQYQVSLYSLDFAIIDKKIDLEIDGDQHHLDQRIVNSDKKRAQFLEADGWTVIRIKWSYYQTLSREEKKCFVKNVLEQLMGCSYNG